MKHVQHLRTEGERLAANKKKRSRPYAVGGKSEERPFKVCPNLYMGNPQDAEQKMRLMELRVTHIVILGPNVKNKYPSSFKYLNSPLHNTEDEDLTQNLEAIFKFIAKASAARRPGSALLLCPDLATRGPAVAIAYLLRVRHVRLNVAYRKVAALAPGIHLSENYRYQLCHYEVRLFSCSSVASSSAGNAWNFYRWNSEKPRVDHYRPAFGSQLCANSEGNGCCCAVM